MPLETTQHLGTTYNMTLRELARMTTVEFGALMLDPPFQRGRVWTNDQQVAWIESTLLGLPLPAIFINEPISSDCRPIVIDGQQRIRTMIDWFAGDLRVRGETFTEQPREFQTKYTLTVTTPVVMTKFKTMRECAALYVKLLVAGTAHTPGEIEKARRVAESIDG